MKRTRERIRRRKAEKVELLPHHRTRQVLQKRNTSKSERLAYILFDEQIPVS